MSDLKSSIAESLSANFDKVAGVDGGEPAKEIAPERISGGVPVDAAKGKPIDGNTEQPRHAKRKEPEKVDPVKAGNSDKTPTITDKTPTEPARDASGKFVSRKFPAGWKKEVEPLWTKPGGHTPEEWSKLQEEAERTWTDSNKNAQGLSERIKSIEPEYNEIQQIIAPYKDVWARNGVRPTQVIGQLFAQAAFADKDFIGFVREQARQRGVDLATLAQPETGQSSDPAISRLTQKLTSLEAEAAERKRQDELRIQAEVSSNISAFTQAQNSDGTPKHPHFDKVRVRMGALMQSDGLDMEGAYEAACKADPILGPQLESERFAKREAERAAELKRQQEASRSAAGSNSGQAAQALPRGSGIRAALIKNMELLEGQARIN